MLRASPRAIEITKEEPEEHQYLAGLELALRGNLEIQLSNRKRVVRFASAENQQYWLCEKMLMPVVWTNSCLTNCK